jgi:hypothetical protein
MRQDAVGSASKMEASMVDTSQIRNGQAVVASDADPVGAVDSVEGDRLKLTRKDSTDNTQHYLPLTWVERVEERIHLNRTGAEVRASWGHYRAAGAAAQGVHGPRKINWTPWITLGLVLLVVLWVMSNYGREPATTTETITTETETVVEPGEGAEAPPPER